MHELFDSRNVSTKLASGRALSQAQRLADSASDNDARIKAVLQSWFSRVPAESKADLKARLESNDDHQHISAAFELYVSALCRRLGCDVEHHPNLPSESQSRPDFKVITTAGEEIIIECVCAFESKQDQRRLVIHDQLVNLLERVGSSYYGLDLYIRSVGHSNLPLSLIRARLEEWIVNLPTPTPSDCLHSVISDTAEPFYWQDGEWDLLVQAVPNEHGRVSSTFHLASDPWSNLSKRFRAKSSKYDGINVPFIIAMNVDALSLEEIDIPITAALFGSSTQPLSRLRSLKYHEFFGFSVEGLWLRSNGTTNRHISGVLIGELVEPVSFSLRSLTLWHNPWATHPVPINTWHGPEVRFNPETRLLTLFDGPETWEVLGLTKGWQDV